jgi:hypothetical protein
MAIPKKFRDYQSARIRGQLPQAHDGKKRSAINSRC